MSLIRSISAESAKLFGLKTWWILLLVMGAYVGALAAGMAAVFGGLLGGEQPMEGLVVAELVYSLGSTIAYAFPVLVGAFIVTAEFRHGTLTPTFLATPSRAVVLGGKVVVAAIVGAVFGVGIVLASVVPGAAVLGATGAETALGDSGTWLLFARTVLAMAIWAVLGLGLGSVFRNQVIVIVIVLAFTQFLEPTLRVALGFTDLNASVGQFLPGAAGDALVGGSSFNAMMGGGGDQLDWWQGGLVLGGMAAVLVLIGALTTWRRDVD